MKQHSFLLALAAVFSAGMTGFGQGTPAGGGKLADYGKLPFSFEINQGQTDGRVNFLARGQGYTLFLTSKKRCWRHRKLLPCA
jgi:hypothetical protein